MDKANLHNRAVDTLLRTHHSYSKISDFIVEKNGERFAVITNFPINKNTGNISFGTDRIMQVLRDKCQRVVIVHCSNASQFEVLGIVEVDSLAANARRPRSAFGLADYYLVSKNRLHFDLA